MRGDERPDVEREDQIARALRRAPRYARIPPFKLVGSRTQRARALPTIIAAATGAVVIAAVLGGQLAEPRDPAGTAAMPEPTPTATRSPLASPTASPTSAPAAGLTRHEDGRLGFRVDLPQRYRLVLAGYGANGAGRNYFVPRTEQEERDLCRTEGTSGSTRVTDLKVEVYPTTETRSPAEFASAPNRKMPFTTVETITVDGLDAARVVQQPTGDTAYYVIRANGRLYEVTPQIISQPSLGTAGGAPAAPRGWLDQIAMSFATIPLQTAAPVQLGRTLCAD